MPILLCLFQNGIACIRNRSTKARYVISKKNDDGEEENTTEAGENNENEASINTGRLAVENIRLKLFTLKTFCGCKTSCVAIEDDDHGKEEKETHAKEETPTHLQKNKRH
ncbi:hypothetical protein EVAR_31245_1 [Eumeta japonica]|uniref:Uncharacterized protein n=1 Tax=Eumeta variegata TaxID=151549 RepID=A0A4C1W0G9_EUMVA|nr:hypothetical protein EVAR_31245_1 [Eumeta japonica]